MNGTPVAYTISLMLAEGVEQGLGSGDAADMRLFHGLSCWAEAEQQASDTCPR